MGSPAYSVRCSLFKRVSFSRIEGRAPGNAICLAAAGDSRGRAVSVRPRPCSGAVDRSGLFVSADHLLLDDLPGLTQQGHALLQIRQVRGRDRPPLHRVRVVQDLRFADATFDTVVCALAFCVIPDQRRALERMLRVLRPGGLLLLLDHIEYTRWPMRRKEERKTHPRGLPRTIAQEVGFTVLEQDGVGRRALGRPFSRWTYRVREEVFLREVGRLEPRGARALDAGGGTGFYVDPWGRLGADVVTGCDMSHAAVGRLRGRPPTGSSARTCPHWMPSRTRAWTPHRAWTCSSTSPTTIATRRYRRVSAGRRPPLPGGPSTGPWQMGRPHHRTALAAQARTGPTRPGAR
ncbi:methyltransferase domain-containing protein [Nocardiopsis listeri]|uniref:methyltransferase domain-containing protein n=1 Tax=Nocardiopsis listeri TaxID=53440 RepID=UPI0016810237